VAKFVKFYSKLSRMISELIDYLEPLKSYDAALSEGDGVQNVCAFPALFAWHKLKFG
jgi:hypothetical protein